MILHYEYGVEDGNGESRREWGGSGFVYDYPATPMADEVADYLGIDSDAAELILSGESDNPESIDDLENESDFIKYMEGEREDDAYEEFEGR